MAPASCSLWPCCERSVTSCLSLCLFLGLPEGPRGTHHGSDGSTAGPCGHGPPGPISACLSASAACTGGHRCCSWRSCRVPGLFCLIFFPLFFFCGQTLWRRARCSQSFQEACHAACSIPDLIMSDLIAQLGMDKETHTCSHTCHLLYSQWCKLEQNIMDVSEFPP